MSGFTTNSSIDIFEIIDVYVKLTNGNIHLYGDASNTTAYPTDPDFEVPCQEQGAIYFYLTPDSDTGATFPDPPFEWLDHAGQLTNMPGSISYEKKTADDKSFSIKVDNRSSHTQDNRYKFYLLVQEANGNIVRFGRKLYGYDPTVVEKGEEEGGTEKR